MISGIYKIRGSYVAFWGNFIFQNPLWEWNQ
jgi:hypothetical protein